MLGSRFMSTAVALITDAYGGFGGIAQYNRDFLAAVADSPQIARVVVIPRLMSEIAEEVPAAIDHRMDALGGISAYAIACTKVMEAERPHVVLCGHVNLLPFALPIATRHRVPLVLSIYGIEVWDPPRLASKALLGTVDHVVSISQLTVDKMHAWSRVMRKCPTSLIPNAVNLQRYSSSPNKPEFLLDRYGLHDKRVLATLARLASRERYKGVDEVLELMPDLVAFEPNISYLVLGDGSDLERLQIKAKELGVAEHVVFGGRVEESEKVAHYQVADAFVMPGRGEGFGFVFLEAMAAGIPVVASILDGSREAVRLGALGELCDPRDPPSTLAAIKRALAKGRGIVPAGIEYFDVPNFRRRVHQFLTNVLN